jgi:histidinol-phosphate aminotransferase
MMKTLLDRNENHYGPSPACYAMLRQATVEQVSFYSRDYLLKRKSELSQQLSLRAGIPEERVLLSYGSEDMLKQVVACYLNGNRTLMLPRQTWWYYKALAAEVHGQHVEYTLREREDRFEYDLEQMTALYDKYKPQIILIASPNNPTGSSMAQADLATFVAHCLESVIVLDQAYHGFVQGQNDGVKGLLDSNDKLVVLRTFSKYYALAGLRIGYAFVGKGVPDLVASSTRYLGYNQLTEKVALAAMDDVEYYTSMARRMDDDKEMYFNGFSELEGFKPFRSDANFILVRYPVAMKELLKRGLDHRGVMVKFLDDPGLEDALRITIGTTEQNARVMSCFKEIVAERRGVRSEVA